MSQVQKATVKIMSFADIVQGRTTGVRITSDGYLYAVDLVMVMSGIFNLFILIQFFLKLSIHHFGVLVK